MTGASAGKRSVTNSALINVVNSGIRSDGDVGAAGAINNDVERPDNRRVPLVGDVAMDDASGTDSCR